ncbi:protein 4.1b isoform X2 [Neoarius graeffei]|uniref:protein 4.1b isoform X2 n=1 Tax=Neoarius graeffei TaxID=443677 RepID=UPI00298BE31F|nr:protein 4.1b isoform X2 [Neoarius graeffei]
MTTFRCRVILLDDTIIERDLEKKAVGQVLFDIVCEYLDLLEKDYFGLALWDSSNCKVWLDFSKRVHKQIIGHDATFTFSVKFYPPDPSVLAEDITRYLLCLQLRKDILTDRLPCPSDMLAVLGSYVIQSEFGDYNPELHGKEFFSSIPLGPSQTPELEEKVTELHRTLKSMSPAQADRLFLQNVRTLDLYGVHLHPAKDASGGDVMLGVCADGFVVYEDEDEEKKHIFIWPRVLNMSFRHSNFHARISNLEDASENTFKFSLPSYRACKCLWKNALEHHAFFRDLDKAPEGLLHLDNRFRFRGLTHAESREASSTINRPAPRFSRSAIKRKAKESLLVALKRPNRTEFDDWFQLLGSDESWPTYRPDKDTLKGGETLAYKEREEVDNEWFQLLGRRSFPTQHSLSFFSSGTDILESAPFQLWKLRADDWFVLLEPHVYHPTFWSLKTRPLSLQTSQAEEQREELEWIERTSEKNIKIVKIRKEVEAVTEQHEELEMERNLMKPDVVGEDVEFDIGDSVKIMKVMRETLEQEGDGEEIQRVVMYEQRTQEVEPHTEQSQEALVGQRIRGMEVVDTVHDLMLKTSQHEELEMERNLMKSDIVGEDLEFDIGGSVKILKAMRETLEQEGDGEEIQRVVMYEQRTQEVEPRTGQSQEALVGQRIRGMEVVDTVHDLMLKTSQHEELEMERNLMKSDIVGEDLEFDIGGSVKILKVMRETLEQEGDGEEIQRVVMYEQRTQEVEPHTGQSQEALVGQRIRGMEVVDTVHDLMLKTSQHEELEMERNLMKSDIVGEDLEFDIGGSVKILKVMRETLEQEGDGKEIQRVVMYEQRTQEVEPHTGQSQEALVEQRIRGMEVVDTVHDLMLKTSQEVFEENIEELEETIQEVESIEQRLKDLERLKVRLQEVEVLEQKLQQVQQAGRQRRQSDDWYILLEHKLMGSSVPARLLGVATSGQKLQDVEKKRQERGERGEWYLLLDRKSLGVSSASAGPTMDTTEQKAEIRQWIEGELQRVSTLTPVQMKDDWYILLELLPRSTQTRQPALRPSEIDIQSHWVRVAEEHKNVGDEKTWREERTIHVRETQPTLPAQREEQRQKQVEDDWFILQDVSPKEAAVDVYKETRKEEVQLVEKEAKPIIFEEERREMIEASQEVVQPIPIPFKKRDVPSGPTMDTAEQKAEIRQWIEGELQRVSTLTPVQMKDDWYILLELIPRSTQTRQPALRPSEIDIQSPWVRVVEEHKNVGDEKTWREERTIHVRETQPALPAQREEQRQKQVEDDWFILQDVSPKEAAVDVYKETRKEEVQLVEKEAKPIIFEEERREMIEASQEVVQPIPIPFKKRDVPSGPTMDTAEQKAEIRQWIEGELQRVSTLTPVQMKDDWYILLELLPRSTQTRQPALRPSEIDIQSPWVHVAEEHKNVGDEKTWREERTIHVREKQPTLPAQREEQRQKQVEGDWFILQDVSPKEAAVDVYKETRKEEVQLVEKEAKPIIFEEERREMIEASQEVVQPIPIPFKKRDVPSGPTMDTAEQKAEIRQWIEGELQRVSTVTPVQMKDDWYILLELLPRSTQTRQPALRPSEIDIQSPWVHVVEEHKNVGDEKTWREERTIYVRETQPTLPAQREEQRQKQVEDDWFILQDVSPKEAAVDVYKETRKEEVQLVEKEAKPIIFEEERREMIEASQEVVQPIPIPFKKRDVPSGPTMDTAEQKAEIRQWIEGELQRVNTLTPVQMKDDWYILLELLPRATQTRQPALRPSEIDIQSPWVRVAEEHKNVGDEKTWREERTIHVRETQPALPAQREEQRQKQVEDDWFILQDVSPKEAAVDVYKETRKEEVQLVKKEAKPIIFEEERREMIEASQEVVQPIPIPFKKRDVPSDAAGLRAQQTVTIKEKGVIFDTKPMIIKEKQVIGGGVKKKILAPVREDEDNWFVLFSPTQIEKMITATGVSDTWILEEKGLREVQKGRLRQDVKRSRVVEDKRLHPYAPTLKAEERHREVIDDWFILLERVSQKSVSMDRRVEEEDWRRKELFKKQAMAEDRRKAAGFKATSVSVISPTRAAQPMTSTPTAQSVHITRPTFKEERLKRLDITQEITQDIKQESKVEIESIIIRERPKKRLEGDSIYVRHSILMLEDSDVTQEMVLRHHASISLLKRIFMEDMPMSAPSEWDRRISTYTPAVFPKLSNGDLFNGIDIMGADGLLAM